MPATVSTPYLRILVDGARQAGVAQVEQLIDRHDLAAVLADLDGRVDQQIFHDLWEELARLSGDPAFGLHLAERVQPGAFAVLDYACRNAPTLGEMFGRIVRYSRLVHNGSAVRLDLHGDEARLSYTLPDSPAGSPRHTAEFIVAVWLCSSRQMCDADFTPRGASFQHARPLSIDEHRRIFRCPLHFEASANALSLERALLSRPVTQADVMLGALLERYARELTDRLAPPDDFGATIKRLIADTLRGGDPSVEAIALKLRMSPRTLQRRLRDEGTSHQELLDALRRELAQRYLREPAIAIGEAAFLLGFSEPSAFHRAFKRWTGTTPGAFRRRASLH